MRPSNPRRRVKRARLGDTNNLRKAHFISSFTRSVAQNVQPNHHFPLNGSEFGTLMHPMSSQRWLARVRDLFENVRGCFNYCHRNIHVTDLAVHYPRTTIYDDFTVMQFTWISSLSRRKYCSWLPPLKEWVRIVTHDAALSLTSTSRYQPNRYHYYSPQFICYQHRTQGWRPSFAEHLLAVQDIGRGTRHWHTSHLLAVARPFAGAI